LPRVVQQNEVSLVVRDQDATLLGGNQQVFIVSVPLAAEIACGNKSMTGCAKD